MRPSIHHRPTPAWVVIGLLTSFLILILQCILYTQTSGYVAFVVSITYTSVILITCFTALLGHLLVRRYPSLGRFLNVDIDLSSSMTLAGAARRELGELPGMSRDSVGGWIEETRMPPPPYDNLAEAGGVIVQRSASGASGAPGVEAAWVVERAERVRYHATPPPPPPPMPA